MRIIRNICIAGAIAISGAAGFACSAPSDNPPPRPEIDKGLGVKEAHGDVKPGVMTKPYDMVEIPVVITNHSDQPSDYYIEASIFDSEGTQVDTAITYVSNVQPGNDASAKLQGAAVVPDAQTYKIVTVERMAT